MKEDLDKLKKEILGEIKRDTNGAVVGSMCDMNCGEPYFSYGVTVAKIKNVVKNYSHNHELALELFSSKIRELKLAAIYMENPQSVEVAQMSLWQQSFDSLEIAEHCASMLFYQCDKSVEVALKWAKIGGNTTKAAFLMASKRTKMCFDIAEMANYNLLLDLAVELIVKCENKGILSSIEGFIAALSNKDKKVRERVVELVENDTFGDSGAEIRWQME